MLILKFAIGIKNTCFYFVQGIVKLCVTKEAFCFFRPLCILVPKFSRHRQLLLIIRHLLTGKRKNSFNYAIFCFGCFKYEGNARVSSSHNVDWTLFTAKISRGKNRGME